MNWDDLRFFLALCRERSVSRAGKSLGVNHTTVARRIAALEESLGARLFDKQTHGYAMTQAAENMYERALRMEEQAQAIDRELFGQDAELKGLLKLTVSHDFAERVIISALPGFQATYPGIELHLMTTTGLIDLSAREADIAVRLTDKPPDYLVGRKVMPLRHGVYGSPSYLREMSDAPNVILFRGNDEQPEWVTEHFPDAVTALHLDDVSTMVRAVRDNMGLARLPCYIGDAEAGVERLDLRLTPSSWGVWVLSHVDLRSTARVRVCREFLFEALEEQQALILGEDSRYYNAV